jgi:eukaryotic-like serine/threonine-protein kinase
MTISSGLTIGKYELGKKLGEGGFGFVFVGRDLSLDREVALKFLHPQHTANPEVLRRFLQEAKSAAKVIHPGIVTVFECGQVSGTGTSTDGVAYIAMELLHGESLADRLAHSGRLKPAVAIEMMRQVASALDVAHRAGIVHRDLKPDNIFLVKDPAIPGGERVKVLDFGIAKLAQAQGSEVQTQSMAVFGTPRYMSPEQCRSAAHIDHRSDIYTLGCILYELVVGAPPFAGETGELIAKHQLVEPPTARSILGDLSEDLDNLISKMLAKDPARRPQTMIAVQRALEAGGAMESGVEPTLLPDAPQLAPTLGTLGGIDNRSPQLRSGSAPAVVHRTTLGDANGQREDEPQRKGKSKAPLLVGGLAVAAIAGVVGFLAVDRSGKEDTVAAPGATTGTVTASAPPTQPPPPTQPKEIELVITSTPKADVFTQDNRLLGDTPFRYKRQADEGKLVFYLRAEGHKDARVLMPADRNGEQDVTLVALPVAAVSKPPSDKPVKKQPSQPSIKSPQAVTTPGGSPAMPGTSSKQPSEVVTTPTPATPPKQPTCGGRKCGPGELPDD